MMEMLSGVMTNGSEPEGAVLGGKQISILICHNWDGVSKYYTRSLDSAPSISALLGLVLIEKLPKSSFSAVFEPISNSAPSISALF